MSQYFFSRIFSILCHFNIFSLTLLLEVQEEVSWVGLRHIFEQVRGLKIFLRPLRNLIERQLTAFGALPLHRPEANQRVVSGLHHGKEGRKHLCFACALELGLQQPDRTLTIFPGRLVVEPILFFF